MNHVATSVARPLLLTEDEHILDAVLRLAAAVGVQVELVSDPGIARTGWSGPPLIVVGADQAAGLARLRPARRSGVVVVGHATDDLALMRSAVELGAERVAALPDDESWLVDVLADIGDGGGAHATVVGVIGGRGGAGASVLAAALAITATARRMSSILIDADPLGGGIDLVLGAEDVAGLRWPDLANTRGRLGGATLRGHLPKAHGITVLSWDRGDVVTVHPDAVSAVIAATARSWELVVIDLPRVVDPVVEEALTRCTTALVVVPAEVRAVAAAARVVSSVSPVAADLRVVVRDAASGKLHATDIAAALGLGLSVSFESEPGLARALERGEPPGRAGRGPLAVACHELLDSLIPGDLAGAA